MAKRAAWCPPGNKIKHLWAVVCADYGIHYVATTKEMAKSVGAPVTRPSCGPHKVKKLVVGN
jgi:hypothetical protein